MKVLRRVCGVSGPSWAARGLATIIPKVSQVDNSSGFLGNVPHRQHPGILHLKTVKLPPELVQIAHFLVTQSSMRDLEKQTKALTNYLWSRKRPLETMDLRRKALEVEQKLREEAILAHPKVTPKSSVLCIWQPEWMGCLQLYHELFMRAAHSIWGKTMNEYMNIDTSAPMLALAERLMKGMSENQEPCFPGVYFRQFLPVSPKVKFDLVVSAFSLNELPGQAQRVETVQTLWRKTDGFLVLIENGTKEGHQMLMEARDAVLKGKDKVIHDFREPYIFAPCPHHLPCPRLSPERPLPCNFIQTYCPLPFSWNPQQKEEKFSFLILRRGPGESKEPWPRITQPVLCRPRHVHVHLCCPDGTLQHAVVTPKKHGRDFYRCARSSQCGDCLPVLNPDSEPALGEEDSHIDKEQS
ncbi:ribosome assembly protein METTL17, mitochondrial isoform X2 [Tiliqua scincoides]|uniref:ribosome assembly protein METTL17, mitochondrial isoform X2 n=1 Tax=Tiliqua scincoides TaxID=71010 RepID=UPI0034629023